LLLLLVLDSSRCAVGASLVVTGIKLLIIKLSLLALNLLDRGTFSHSKHNLHCWLLLCICAIAKQIVFVVQSILFDCIAWSLSVFALDWRGRTTDFII
jgi:hypothetical protein